MDRREFLEGSAAVGAAGGLATFGFDLAPAYAQVRALKISRATEVRSVCPYCAVGCSMIAYVTGHESFNTQSVLVHIEGDPDSPINGGSLCPKGASTMQLAVNERRDLAPLYRPAGARDWQRISWDDALDRLARLMKSTRDKTFVAQDENGRTVNRNEGIAFVGGATYTNEEGYLAAKFFRSLGTVYIEQQASGVQIIRALGMVQLLLGNMGRPGGGVNAERGHANIQGNTDNAISWEILPGYLAIPRPPMATIDDYLARVATTQLAPESVNFFGANYRNFLVSFLKTWFGDASTPENDWGYSWIPKPAGNASWLTIHDNARRGTLKGLFASGMSGVNIGPDSKRMIASLGNLEWLVAMDPLQTATATFWKAPGVAPEEIDTEVFLLVPGADLWQGAACPACGGPPQVSVIAERSGEFLGGSPRWLVCSRCATWWGYPRATCPACGEDDPTRLSPFQADGWPWVRVDGCGSCGGYAKTFDLRQDGARDVIPLIDDIASLALDLWAHTHGLHRPTRSLAGV